LTLLLLLIDNFYKIIPSLKRNNSPYGGLRFTLEFETCFQDFETIL
jgi:hypothetical protein